MFKTIMITFLSLLSSFCFASTHNISRGEVYKGLETYNEQSTGNICYITIRRVISFSEKGMHCYKINFQFNSVRTDLPKNILEVSSRVTNYHRDEFPEVKTCAMSVDGGLTGDDIYSEETSGIYNQIFGGQHKDARTRFDYFLTLEPREKKLTRARVHVMKLFKEYDVDCIDLIKF